MPRANSNFTHDIVTALLKFLADRLRVQDRQVQMVCCMNTELDLGISFNEFPDFLPVKHELRRAFCGLELIFQLRQDLLALWTVGYR